MENILKIAPVSSGEYMAKVLDCYYDEINTTNGEKTILRLNLKVRNESEYYNIDTVTFCSDYDYSEYQILINQIVNNFGLEEFLPKYIVRRFVTVNLTTRTDNKGNEYMKIINIIPYRMMMQNVQHL